jgi:hypothetical protein
LSCAYSNSSRLDFTISEFGCIGGCICQVGLYFLC